MSVEDQAVQVEVTIDLDRPQYPRRSRKVKRPETPAAPRIPRISRLMALAIKFQEMIDRREVRDYADIARLGYVTRARITQIMNLLNLAPDIQERLLLLSGEQPGWHERELRPLARQVCWADQRALLTQVLGVRGLPAIPPSRRW
jgi:hypothetical protein